MYLLDTNHCSYILQGNPDVCNRFQELGENLVAICPIVQAELIFMAQNSQRQLENIENVRNFIQDIEIYPITSITAEIYGEFKAELIRHFGAREKIKRRRTKLSDIGIQESDLWIASIAIQHNLTLVSADRDFQRIQEVRSLSIESWYSPPTEA